MRSSAVLPVLVSILVIVLVAVIERQSKIVAAITATMPLTAPLSLWIVAASEAGDPAALTLFSGGLLLSSLPTVLFLCAAWFAARAGWKVGAIILIGYASWALGLAVIFGLRRVVTS